MIWILRNLGAVLRIRMVVEEALTMSTFSFESVRCGVFVNPLELLLLRLLMTISSIITIWSYCKEQVSLFRLKQYTWTTQEVESLCIYANIYEQINIWSPPCWRGDYHQKLWRKVAKHYMFVCGLVLDKVWWSTGVTNFLDFCRIFGSKRQFKPLTTNYIQFRNCSI